jgi:hypothetical protein
MKSHRSLMVHKAEYVTQVKAIVEQYKNPAFPDEVGQFIRPINHNYAYGINRLAMVADLKYLYDKLYNGDFMRFYESTRKGSWIYQKNAEDFVKEFHAKVKYAIAAIPSNSDELCVLYVEYLMRDQELVLQAGNTTHIFLWVVMLLCFTAMFGLNLKFFGWLMAIGIGLSEFAGYFGAVSGSSIISFMFVGAVFFGAWTLKGLRLPQVLAIAVVALIFIAPLVQDPPLAQNLFLSGKSVAHVYHFQGFFWGGMCVKYLL